MTTFTEVPNTANLYNFTITRIVNGFRFSDELKGVYRTYKAFIDKQKKKQVSSKYDDAYDKFLALYPSLVS